MHIQNETYQVWYDASTSAVVFQGALRLSGMDEYQPISELLRQAVQENAGLTIDLRQLKFLNSSGINMLSKFVITLRAQTGVSLHVNGSKKIPWQGKSLKNLERLMPNLTLNLE